MKSLILNKVPRIIKGKPILERALNVKLEIKGNKVEINGNSVDEYTAEKVIEALDFGFPFKTALLIKEEDLIFEIINIKHHTTKTDFVRIRARIIGRNGKILKTLSNLTDCFFELKDNEVGVIGYPENIETANQALISLIKGSKIGNVYAYLEKHHPQEVVDLGLKEVKKKQ